MNYPICANHRPLISLQHQDIDEQAARLTGYDQEYQQMSCGHFQGSFLTCEVDNDLAMYFESTNQALLQTGVVPDGYFAVGLLMESPEPMVFNSQIFPKGSAFLLSPNSELSGTVVAGMNICVIHMSTDLLEKFCGEQFLKRFDPDFGGLRHTILKSEERTRVLHDLIHDFIQGVNKGSLYLNQYNQSMAFKKALAAAIEWVFLESDSEQPGNLKVGSCGRQKVFQEARQLINDNMRDDVPVQSICHRLGVSRRTLEYSFHENIEMSPARYIKLLRLNNIRREIISSENHSTPIGDLAAQWGIWHLGRFAKDYQMLFGELPSSTRR